MSLCFAQRSYQPERMDLEVLDTLTAGRILYALEKINAWLGGVRATLYHLERYSKHWRPGESIRFIDWGTGGADIPRAIVRWCRARGFRAEVTGVDSNGPVLDYAREACRDYPEIRLVKTEAQDFSGAPAAFDYAISSLTLHHLKNEEIIRLMQKSDLLVSRGIIMNDLKRSARAWAWIWALSRLGRADPIVQHDGPLSVKRAFIPQELKGLAHAAGVTYLHVKTHFGYRLTLAGEKNG